MFRPARRTMALRSARGITSGTGCWGNRAAACVAAIRDASLPSETLAESELLDRTADLMIGGKVVGWYQGRMEFGARALGNRSLIADPRRTDMRDIINLRIKFREKFRPFAPSILEERVGAYCTDSVPSTFREKVISIRAEKRAEIPAVTHVDGTGRLQTVSRST